MKCNCGNENSKESKFCPECGVKIVIENNQVTVTLPKMLTVKESYELIFRKKVSLTKIYELIKTRSIPHVNANGKLLLDADMTIKWWHDKLTESTNPTKLTGLRQIS